MDTQENSTTLESPLNIDALLADLDRVGGNNIHLRADMPPLFRVRGDLEAYGQSKLTTENIQLLAAGILSPESEENLQKNNYASGSYESASGAFRFDFFKQQGRIQAVFRKIDTENIPLEQLGAPQEILKLSEAEKGLIIVCGHTGAGKTTTIASLVDAIQQRRTRQTILVEDPVEIGHKLGMNSLGERQTSIIEIGEDQTSIPAACRDGLVSNPELLVVGEMRCLETIELALEAARDRLVIGTMAATSPEKALSRIVDAFSAEDQSRVADALDETLVGVIAQNREPDRDLSPEDRKIEFDVLLALY